MVLDKVSNAVITCDISINIFNIQYVLSMHFSPQFYACICVVYVCISSICMSACLIYMNRDSTVYSKFVLCSNLFDNAGSLEDPASTLPTNMLFSPMVKAVPKNQKTFSALVPPRSRHFTYIVPYLLQMKEVYVIKYCYFI